MNEFARDLRHAVRSLRKAPGFALVVILTLGLGIGANAAIFSLLDQVLLRSLPVKNPQGLVLLDGPGAFRGRTFNNMTFSYPMYLDFRDKNEVLSGVLARFATAATVVWQGQSERASAELVTGNYFDVLGVPASIGRVITPDDDKTPGAHPVAVLSHGYWTRRFGANPAILDQAITVNGHPYTVIGVSAPGFESIQVGEAVDVRVPMMMKAQMTSTWNDLDNRRSRWVNVMGRLKPGVTREAAAAQLNVVYKQANMRELAEMTDVSENFRQRFASKTLNVLPGYRGMSGLRDQFSSPLVIMMAMVGAVLLIACANVANLLLARTTSRQREISLRLALGAGRARILRQYLAESLVLSAAGAAVGLVLATWTGSFLLSALPGDAASRTLSASLDLRVVGFALALSFVTALLFGTAPALHATRATVTAALKEEAGSVAGGHRQARLRRVLVVGQIAVSTLLLVGAGLFARSLYNLKSLDPGFEVDHLLSFAVDPTLNGYQGPRVHTYYDQLRHELARVPGVRSVSTSAVGLLTGSQWGATVRVEGYQAKEGEDMNPSVDAVGPGFFSTMGIPIVAGREFTEQDAAGSQRVAVINETMARYFFGDTNPVGRRFGFGRDQATDIEIVGVAKDVRSLQLRDQPVRFVYVPNRQEPETTGLVVYLRIAAGSGTTAGAVRQAAARIDPNLPIFDMKSMALQVDESLFVERMVAALSIAFGALAALLAAIGLYGVMAYAVARRTREIGIRVALGADRSTVLWLVLRDVALMAVAGASIGLGAALYATRRIEAQLFGLSPTDAATLAAAVGLLVAIALLAGFIPARRATAIDPMVALRTE